MFPFLFQQVQQLQQQPQTQIITSNGGISADYTMIIMVGVIGFLLVALAGIVGNNLVSTLTEIKNTLKDHAKMLNEHQTKHELTDQRLEGVMVFDSNKVADTIITKLRASGNSFKV